MAGGMSLLAVMTVVLPPAQVVPLHGVVQLASNSTRATLFVRHVKWRIVLVYAPPMFVGLFVATLLWTGEAMGWFRPAIGVFVLLFLVWRRYAPRLRNLPLWSYAIVGFVVGILAIFVGATGPFIAPFFLRDDLDKEQIIGTKAACQTLVHLGKLPAFLSIGFDYTPHLSLLLAMTAAVMVGTVAGKWVLGRMSKRVFTLIFEGVLASLALYLVARGLLG